MTYAKKDYVDVVDDDGNPVPGFAHPVPKAWVGTPLLPAGAKAAPKGRSNRSAKADGDSGDGPQPDQDGADGAAKDPADSSGADNKTGSEGS